ncbi:MAG: hypothetical protein Q8N96_01425 [Methylovulum sp.]|nr:hypothetical protein [Methylovulum sp.]
MGKISDVENRWLSVAEADKCRVDSPLGNPPFLGVPIPTGHKWRFAVAKPPYWFISYLMAE